MGQQVEHLRAMVRRNGHEALAALFTPEREQADEGYQALERPAAGAVEVHGLACGAWFHGEVASHFPR
jgi:hypothetical protein